MRLHCTKAVYVYIGGRYGWANIYCWYWVWNHMVASLLNSLSIIWDHLYRDLIANVKAGVNSFCHGIGMGFTRTYPCQIKSGKPSFHSTKLILAAETETPLCVFVQWTGLWAWTRCRQGRTAGRSPSEQQGWRPRKECSGLLVSFTRSLSQSWWPRWGTPTPTSSAVLFPTTRRG